MQFLTKINQKLPFFVALGLMAVLTSCGSYQYVGYDNDGIYGSHDYDYTTEVEEPVVTTSANSSNYYKNYFAENSAEIDAINGEKEIFTDADSYQDNYTRQDSLEQRQPYGGWGQNNSSVTVNVIDNGWYGWNDPWLWNGGFGMGWGQPWGWNRWGWNNPWAWNAGWGFGGWGFGGWGVGGFGYGGWGFGYNNWGWNNGYYGNPNRYAFSNSRRGSLLNNNNLSRNSRSNSAISTRNYSTRNLSNSANRTRNTRATSGNSTIRNSRSAIPTRSIRNSSTTNRNYGTMRSSGNTRSSGTTRSSGSTARSGSSSSRSSGGSVRSSGGSRSSSGSRGSSGGGRRGGGRG